MRKLVIIAALALGGCSDTAGTYHFGGAMRTQLPCGYKLENVTWKMSGDAPSLWYLTRPMRPGEFPETHSFVEKSGFGIWEGSVTIEESVCVENPKGN